MRSTGMLLLGLTASSAVPADAAQRAPDAHVIRREHGDVIDFSNGPRTYPGDGRAGSYVAPVRGWHYRPVRAGERLRPLFYGPRYVIANPARHGVPPARGNRRWIRYGEDLLLVNIRSGRILQVLAGRYR